MKMEPMEKDGIGAVTAFLTLETTSRKIVDTHVLRTIPFSSVTNFLMMRIQCIFHIASRILIRIWFMILMKLN